MDRSSYRPSFPAARSAGDDKMPIVALVHTLDALAANDIGLSVSLKLLLDETGRHHRAR